MKRALAILMATILASSASLRAEDAPKPAPAAVGVQYWFGVATENIPPSVARHIRPKLEKGQGLMVVAVLPRSPAAQAMLQEEDLLIEVNGKPLMTHEDLAKAANIIDPKTLLIKPANLSLLRDGERMEVTLSPAPRPEEVVVLNPPPGMVARLEGTGPAINGDGVKTIVAPNGQTVSVGTGFVIPVNSADARRLKIGELKDKVVLSVATDNEGKQHHKITVGGKTYAVEKEKLGDLPEEVRPLADELLRNGPQQVVKQRARSTEDQLKDQQREIQQLREQVDKLIRENEKK